jgi:hypothetical protein
MHSLLTHTIQYTPYREMIYLDQGRIEVFIQRIITTWTCTIFSHYQNKPIRLLFYQEYVIFMYVHLTKTCKILRYWCHNIYMIIVTYLIALCFKNIWCQLPEDGDIIVPKHVEAMEKTVHLNYRIVLLLVLQELFTLSRL